MGGQVRRPLWRSPRRLSQGVVQSCRSLREEQGHRPSTRSSDCGWILPPRCLPTGRMRIVRSAPRACRSCTLQYRCRTIRDALHAFYCSKYRIWVKGAEDSSQASPPSLVRVLASCPQHPYCSSKARWFDGYRCGVRRVASHADELLRLLGIRPADFAASDYLSMPRPRDPREPRLTHALPPAYRAARFRLRRVQ